MSDTVLKIGSKVAIKKETTQGEYAAPSASDLIEVLDDGLTIEKSRDKKERVTLTGNRAQKNFRLGNKNVTAAIPVECKAGSAEGDLPEYSPLFEAFGFDVTGGLSASVISETGHTTTVINIDAGDISNFKVNDIVMIKEAGDFHISPISVVGTTSITLKIPMASAPADNVVIAKSKVLKLSKAVDETLSITHIMDGEQTEERVIGSRTESIELSNFTMGEIPSWAFSLVGLNYQDSVNTTSLTPSFDTSEPPLIVGSCIYKDATRQFASEFTLSLAQTVAFLTSTCASNGKYASRGAGKFEISGTINPYKDDDSINFSLDESEFSIFVHASNPTSTEGEKKQAIAIFLPKVKATTVATVDREGVLADQVTFEAIADSDEDLIRIAFI